jgi:hypothetical protein
VGLLTVGLVAGGATAANAGRDVIGFTVTLPTFQIPATAAKQKKAITNQAGYFSATKIGANYNADAEECGSALQNCGTKVYNVYTGSARDLPNKLKKGAVAELKLRSSGFNAVKVTATGWWASN